MSLSYPYTFKVNSTNLASYVERYSYSTAKIPVYSDTVTTLDGVDHAVIIRWKHQLTVTLNPMSEATLATVQAALGNATVASVQFASLQDGSVVTKNMRITPSASVLALKNATRRVLDKVTLTFEEL